MSGPRAALTAGTLTAVLLLAGCGDDSSDASTDAADDQRLAEAMCADLEDGMSLLQLHRQAVDYYQGHAFIGDSAQSAAAQLEDLATREHCPQFRDEFEATIIYEKWIAP